MLDFGPEKELTVQAHGPVRVVRLNRAEAFNAVNPALHDALIDVWRVIDRDQDARVVVLTGEGKHFCAGGDFALMKATHHDDDLRIRELRQARQLVGEMLRFRLPIIAAVNGAAVGLGATLALASDLILISDKGHLSDPHVSIGLAAGDGGAVLWPLYASLARVKEFLFTGDRVTAELAVQVGLANRSVPAEELLDEAMALAERIALQPPHALQFTKRALALRAERSLLDVGDFAATAELHDMSRPEHREIIRDLVGPEKYDALPIATEESPIMQSAPRDEPGGADQP